MYISGPGANSEIMVSLVVKLPVPPLFFIVISDPNFSIQYKKIMDITMYIRLQAAEKDLK